MFKLDQGIIQHYSSKEPRVCDVLQIPDGYVISQVRLPQSIGWQTKPLEGSLVLVASPDSYKSFIICVLRDAGEFLDQGEGVRGSTAETGNFFQPGEIQLEAAGDISSGVSGTGGSLYLGNDGTVNIYSGQRKEYLTIGGRKDDKDSEVLLIGDNGFFQSNVNPLTLVRSTYRFNDLNTLELGNYAVLITPVAEIETPISQLKMSTLGQITLQNTTLGVPNGVVEIAVDGKITVKNNFGTETISNIGAYSFSNPTSSVTLSNVGDYAFTNPTTSVTISNAGAYSFTNPATTVTLSSSGDLKLYNSIGGALHIAPNGKVALGSSTAELLDLFDQTLAAIIALTVGTGVGPSSPPLNTATFTTIKSLLATIKGTL